MSEQQTQQTANAQQNNTGGEGNAANEGAGLYYLDHFHSHGYFRVIWNERSKPTLSPILVVPGAPFAGVDGNCRVYFEKNQNAIAYRGERRWLSRNEEESFIW